MFGKKNPAPFFFRVRRILPITRTSQHNYARNLTECILPIFFRIYVEKDITHISADKHALSVKSTYEEFGYIS